jgi:hypothetical protein
MQKYLREGPVGAELFVAEVGHACELAGFGLGVLDEAEEEVLYQRHVVAQRLLGERAQDQVQVLCIFDTYSRVLGLDLFVYILDHPDTI